MRLSLRRRAKTNKQLGCAMTCKEALESNALISWVEPDFDNDPRGTCVYFMHAKDVIHWFQRPPELTDEDILDEFIVCMWAEIIE